MEKNNKSENANFRQKAEELLKTDTSKSVSVIIEAEMLKLIHELEVKQIELKIQNEELSTALIERKRAEESLIASDNRYRRLFESAKDGILILDADTGMIIDVNPFLIEMLGYSEDQFRDKAIWEIGFFRDLIDNHDKFLELQQNEYVCYDDLPLETADGRKISVEFVSNSYFEDNQKVIQCNIREITKRKDEALALRNSEFQHRTLVQTIPDLIWLKNTEGVYLSCNTRFERLFGAREADIIGKTDYDFVDRERADFFRENDRIVMEAGKPTSNEEWVTFAEDGHREFLDTIKTPMLDFNGKLIGVLGIGRDNTQRKLAEQNVRASEKRFRAIFDQAPVAIALLDTQGHPIISNLRLTKMIGYSSDELAKMMFTEFTYPEDIDKDLNQFTDLIAGKISGYNIEKRYIHKNGTLIWANLYTTTLNDSNGLIQEIIGMVEDITERKKAEDALLENEIKYRAFFENSMDAIFLTSPDGKTLSANQAACNMFGYSEDELIKLGRSAIVDRSDSRLSALLDERKLKGKARGEVTLLRKDRTQFPAEISSAIFKNQEGFELTSMIIRDITKRKLTEEAQRESEQLYRSLFENMINGFAYCKMIFEEERPQDFIYLAVNNSFEIQTGLKDVIGKKATDVIPGIRKSDPVLFEVYGRVALSGKPETIEIYVKALKMWYSISIYSPVNEHFVAIFDVIDKRKNAEEVLRQSEAKFRKLISSLPDPVLVVDSQGRIVYCNENTVNIFDYNIDEMLNRTMEDLIPKHFRELHKTLRNEYISSPKRRAMGQGKELFAQRKDGSEFPTEIMLEPVEINGNQFTLAIVRDITERKKIQNELKLQANLLSNVGQSVIATDLSGIVIYWNNAAEKMYGWSSVEAIGQNIISLTPTQSTREQAAELMKKLSEGESWTGEFIVKRKDGSSFPALVTDTPILDSNGKLTGIIGISSDITERKLAVMELIEAKEKAEESDRLKTAFLNNVSHEIRTPLNAIVGFSGFLNDPDLKPENRQEFTDIILQSSDQLLAIIDDIMSIASVEAGQEKIQEDEVNINLICNLLKEQFSSKANEKNVTLNLKSVVSDDQAIVITDATKLTQILNNLVGNALKFTRQGYINYGYKIKDSEVEFYVEDSGIGIQLDMQEIIFDRFRQIETTSTRNFGGSGLGLSISKAYVEMLGGKMWLTSELGKGSVFYFTIPYKNANPKKLPDIPSVKGLDFEFKTTKTVLIAEDEISNFILLKEMLSNSGITMIRAKNGLEAVKLCQSNPNIDLVLMDIKMPEMDGYEATKRIKEFKPDLPIIAQTAYVTEADRIKALACGCSDYISKPISKQLLLSKINEQLHH